MTHQELIAKARAHMKPFDRRNSFGVASEVFIQARVQRPPLSFSAGGRGRTNPWLLRQTDRSVYPRHKPPRSRKKAGWGATTCFPPPGKAGTASRLAFGQPPLKVSPNFSGEPVARRRFWRTSRTLGRVPGTAGQVAGGGEPKTHENRPLQPKPGGVKMPVMKRTDSLAVGSRWPIIPKWEDRQTCLIIC